MKDFLKKISPYVMFVSSWVLILAAVLLGERMTPRMLAGAALICGGVAAEVLRPAEAPPERAAEDSQILTEETK